MTHTAKLLYALLLDRANLSQANGWVDEQGRIYLIFPIEKIAEALDKGCMTVKNALNELTDAGLIERQRQRFAAPNRIYVLLPDGQKTVRMTDKKLSLISTENCPTDGQKIVPMTDKKLSLISTENCPTDGQKIVPMTDRKLSPNNLSNNNLNRNNLRGVREPPTVFGRYENVFLTDTELSELKAELSDKWEYYVERLSKYMTSTGKSYDNHAATIRKWAAEDQARGASKQGVPQTKGGLNQTIPDYTKTEGISL